MSRQDLLLPTPENVSRAAERLEELRQIVRRKNRWRRFRNRIRGWLPWVGIILLGLALTLYNWLVPVDWVMRRVWIIPH